MSYRSSSGNPPIDVRPFIKAIGKVPAYLTLPAAAASYIALHHFSDLRTAQSLTAATGADNPILGPLAYLAAQVGQYAVPGLLAVGACSWSWGAFQRFKLKQLTARSAEPDVMAGLTWEQFERIVAQAFVNRGYAASLSCAGADGGVDVILKKDGKTWLVQAKHYQKSQVGAETVRSLYGVMQKYGAVGCYVITSGTFTGPARDFAKGLPIHLISGPALRNLIREGSTEAGGSLSLEREALDKAKPLCRECGHPLLIRTAKKGANIGNRFLGCSDFPNCTYTEALD